MAHQIVTEVFQLEDADHSQSFQEACDLLQLPLEFRRGSGSLVNPGDWKNNSGKTDIIVTIMERVQKLMALAKSTSEAEAAVALAKAQELVRKYNIQENLYSESKEDFRYLVIDTKKQRLNPIYSHLASLLIQYYNVDVVFTTTYNVKLKKNTQCLEVFGRQTQVVIAEYVFEFLWRVLESLWLDHSKGLSREAFYKKSFQLGIIAGFQEKLEQEKKKIVVETAKNEKSLVAQEDAARRVFVKKRYPRLRSRTSGRSSIDRDAYDSGMEQGRDVEIRRGIQKNKDKRFLLKGMF